MKTFRGLSLGRKDYILCVTYMKLVLILSRISGKDNWMGSNPEDANGQPIGLFPNSKVKPRKALTVLGWVTAREVLRY